MLPAFSPDGRSIAYLARPAKNAYGRNVRLYVVPSDGAAGATCLTSALDRSCGALQVRPLWSPDGRSIVVAGEDHGDVGLWRAAASGHEPPSRIVGGARSINGFSASADGTSTRFRGQQPDGAGRGLHVPGGRRRRAPAERAESRVDGFGGAFGSGTLSLHARRLRARRLGDAPGRFRRRAAVPDARQHPRGSSRAVRPQLLRRVPGVRRRGLRRRLHQPARQSGIRRRLHPGGSRRLGRRRLRRRDGRARRGRGALSVHRSRSARGARRQLRRLSHELDRRPLEALQGRMLRARGELPVHDVRHQRHRP